LKARRSGEELLGRGRVGERGGTQQTGYIREGIKKYKKQATKMKEELVVYTYP